MSLERNPKICVAVPVHDGGKTLERCLSNLQNQTFTDFCVLIMENVSSDQTVDISKRFCRNDQRFELAPSDKFLTAHENFARAIRCGASKAPYFCLRAADDYSDKSFLSALAQVLDTESEVDLAVPHIVYVDSNGAIIENLPDRERAFLNASANPSRQFVFPASWYYGLYRCGKGTDTLLDVYLHFPSVWGLDRLTIWLFAIKRKIKFNKSTVFFCEVGSASQQLYMPDSLRASMNLRFNYIRSVWKILDPAIRPAWWRIWQVSGKHTKMRSKRMLKQLLVGKF